MYVFICIILDNYNVARLKTKKAECTSDLNSEVEGDIKRKRMKNRLYPSDIDDSDKENSISTKRKEMKGLFHKQKLFFKVIM